MKEINFKKNIVIARVMIMALMIFTFASMNVLADTLEAPCLIISGNSVHVNANSVKDMSTYTGHTFCLSKQQVEKILAEKSTISVFGRELWRKGVFYSSFENHSGETYYYHCADGIYINDLLAEAGVSGEDIAALNTVTFKATDNYLTSIGLYNSIDRYYFKSTDTLVKDADKVQPMLAYFQNVQYKNSEGLSSSTPSAVDGGVFPTLVFGQTDVKDINNCSFAKDTQQIDLGGAVAFDLTLKGTQNTTKYYTVSDLMLMEPMTNEYQVNGKTYRTYGVDLKAFLEKIKVDENSSIKFTVTNAGTTRESSLALTKGTIKNGAYMLAYYSENIAGGAVKNDTEVMLYGNGVAMGNVISITVEGQGEVDAVSGSTVKATKTVQAPTQQIDVIEVVLGIIRQLMGK